MLTIYYNNITAVLTIYYNLKSVITMVDDRLEPVMEGCDAPIVDYLDTFIMPLASPHIA